jgi:hypothetical protein
MSMADAGGAYIADLMDLGLGQAEGSSPCNGNPAPFGHGFAIGERLMVSELLSSPEAVQATRQQMTESKKHRVASALGQARLWAAFVKARDRYRATSDGDKCDPAAVAEALEEMQEAYKRWSFS